MTTTPPRRVLRRLTATALALALGTASLALAPAAYADSRTWLKGSYVALGDSYASGEGLAPYEKGTDTADNTCHRSKTKSYPELLESGRDRGFDKLLAATCSGARTSSLFAKAPADAGEPAQLSALSLKTRTVTMTMGGNDVGFSTVLASCIYAPFFTELLPGREGCRNRLDTAVSARIANLSATSGDPAYAPSRSLPESLAAIAKRAPQADIYVTGYPELFGSTFNSPYGCEVARAFGFPIVVSAADAAWAVRKSAAMNAAIALSVQKAQAAGIKAHFVSVDFTGHNVCDSGTPWINSLIVTTDPVSVSTASFHPTAQGAKTYAAAIRKAYREQSSADRP